SGVAAGLHAMGAPPGRGTTPAGATVRVAAERIDAVVGLVGEALRASAALGGSRELADVLATAEEAALRLRLVALAGIVAPLERAVRDAARLDGKQAVLVVDGAEVEADATGVDVAAEAVLQL